MVDHLEVQAGWEQAVETLLGDALRAVGTAELERDAKAEALLPGLVLLDTREPDGRRRSCRIPPTRSCRARAPLLARRLLGGVWVAEGLVDARDDVTPGAGRAADDPRGREVGRDWLGVSALDQGDGVLARAEVIKSLRVEIHGLLARESDRDGRGASAGRGGRGRSRVSPWTGSAARWSVSCPVEGRTQ